MFITIVLGAYQLFVMKDIILANNYKYSLPKGL